MNDSKRKFRLVFDETRRFYCIQRKVFWGWYKTLDLRYRELCGAQAKVDKMRREYIKFKTKSKYKVLDY